MFSVLLKFPSLSVFYVGITLDGLEFTITCTIAMERCSDLVHGSPVPMSLTRRLFKTSNVRDGGHETQIVVTAVTLVALDLLMRPALQTPIVNCTNDS
jgi:hypothetical protein